MAIFSLIFEGSVNVVNEDLVVNSWKYYIYIQAVKNPTLLKI